MPCVSEVKGSIHLFSQSESRYNGLVEEVVFKITKIIRIAKQEIRKRKSGETGLAGRAEFKCATGQVSLGVIVVSSFKLKTKPVAVASAHEGDTGSEIVLSIAVLNIALSLRTHYAVGDVRYARGWRCSHYRWNSRIVTSRPTNRGQIKGRVFWTAVIAEPADTGVEIENHYRAWNVVIGRSNGVAKIFFPA